MKYPSYCCQKCGELIGWIGRVMPFHKCKEKNMNPLPRYNEKGELDTRLRVDPVTGDVGIGTSKEKEHMTKDEALQLALDSMKEIIHWYAVRDRNDVFLNFVDQNPEIQKIMKAITAVEESLKEKNHGN